MVKGILDFLLTKKMLKNRPLCIFIPKKSAYRRYFDKTKYTSFLIKDEKLLEKYNKIWKNLRNIITKEFDSKAIYNEKHLKTKIKSYNGKINTNFHNNKIPKKGSQCICLSIILLDSVYRKENILLSVFLEECKYVVKEEKDVNYIELSSNDSVRENSDEESSN